jgi:hypothetical protein
VTILLLALAMQTGVKPLTLAAGQGNLYAAHGSDFPKVGWVASKPLPVSSSPQFAGPMSGVIPVGTAVEVGSLGTPVPRGGEPGVLDEVLVLSLGPGPMHRAGYVLARGVPVFETILARCTPSVVVFSTVVGSRFVEGIDGMVLDLEVWVRPAGVVPRLVAAGTNGPQTLRALSLDRGAAVALAGEVVVLAGDGSEVWRSPRGERWTLDGAVGGDVRVAGPTGSRQIIRVPAI